MNSAAYQIAEVYAAKESLAGKPVQEGEDREVVRLPARERFIPEEASRELPGFRQELSRLEDRPPVAGGLEHRSGLC